MTETLQHPAAVMQRLLEIENDLALRQNELEEAAMEHFRQKREREHQRAFLFVEASGTDGQRKAFAERESALIGQEEEARYVGVKAVVDVLIARASIGQSILRSQSRF